jgi:hypothetical protein
MNTYDRYSFIFQYISNKMQLYTVYLYLETALHVSGITSTHHQEHIHLYLQDLVFVTPLRLPAATADAIPDIPLYQMLQILLYELLMMGGSNIRNM